MVVPLAVKSFAASAVPRNRHQGRILGAPYDAEDEATNCEGRPRLSIALRRHWSLTAHGSKLCNSVSPHVPLAAYSLWSENMDSPCSSDYLNVGAKCARLVRPATNIGVAEGPDSRVMGDGHRLPAAEVPIPELCS